MPKAKAKRGPKVTLRPKSSFQKDDCLFCECLSTQEAVCGAGDTIAMIRCCEAESCVEKAKKMALDHIRM